MEAEKYSEAHRLQEKIGGLETIDIYLNADYGRGAHPLQGLIEARYDFLKGALSKEASIRIKDFIITEVQAERKRLEDLFKAL